MKTIRKELEMKYVLYKSKFREKVKNIKRKAIIYAIVFWVISTILYYLAPHITVAKSYHNNPSNSVIPIISWTVIIYITLYPQVILVFYHVKSNIVLKNIIYAYAVAILIGFILFIFVPITIKQPQIHPTTIFDKLLIFIKTIDVQKGNAFPSLHVVLSLLGPLMLIIIDKINKKTIFLMIWGICISFTTITTAQHNIIDVIAGVVIAIILAYIFAERTKKEKFNFFKKQYKKFLISMRMRRRRRKIKKRIKKNK